ncbi:MAG: hypothetical protein ACYCU0_10445 [Solirubrobacteraceae bacterium]
MRRRTALIASGITLVLAGCGSSHPTAPAEPTITKAAFVTRAEAICKVAEAKLARLHYPKYSHNKYLTLLRDEGRVMEKGVSIEKKTWGELEELPRPAVGGAVVKDWLVAMSEVTAQSLQEARANEQGIEKRFGEAAVKRESRSRKAYGIKCNVG